MFDARLVQSTRVLVGLVNEPLGDMAAYPGEPIVLRGWHGQASGVGEALAFKEGHAYENKLAFQVWDAQGHLLLRSDSAPTTPLAVLADGYATVRIDGEQWRTFTLQTSQGRRFQSGERADIRREHRWVVYPPSLRSVTLMRAGTAIDVPVQGDLVTDSAASRLAFVLAGEGIARLPAYDAAAPIASGDLVRVLPEVETAPLEIFLLHGRRIGPSARLLRDFLLSGPDGEQGQLDARD